MSIRKNIKATNLELIPEISDYLEKRLKSVERLIDPKDTSAIFNIEVERDNSQNTGNVFRAEINLSIAGGQMRAEEKDETLFNAIDSAKNELLQEVRKIKGKRLRLLRKGGAGLKRLIKSIGIGRK